MSEEGVFMFSYRAESFSGCESHPGTWIKWATEQLIQHPAPGTFICFPSADSAEAVKWGALHPTLHLHPNSLHHTGKTRVFSPLCTHADPRSITYSLHPTLHMRSHYKCQLLIEMYIAHVLVPSWHLIYLLSVGCIHMLSWCVFYMYAIIVCVLYTQVIFVYMLYKYIYAWRITLCMHIIVYIHVCYICMCVVCVVYYVWLPLYVCCICTVLNMLLCAYSHVLIKYPQTSSRQADSIYYM